VQEVSLRAAGPDSTNGPPFHSRAFPQRLGGEFGRSLRVIPGAFHMRSTADGVTLEGMSVIATAAASPTDTGVEELRELIAALVARRQQLRALSAGRATLEQNRLELACAQRELGHALVEQHLPPGARR
jgi:hypothetical protein